MSDYHTENDAINKGILQKLAEDCDDADTAFIISCYDIGARGVDIRKQMNKVNIDPLKKAAAYLQVYPNGETTKKKAAIIIDIVTRINCLLRELCGICGSYYHIDVTEKPIYRCIICKQGGHDKCLDRINTMHRVLDENQRNAFPFMCSSCLDDHKDINDEAIEVKAPRNKKSSNIQATVETSDKTNSHDEDPKESDVPATNEGTDPHHHQPIDNANTSNDHETSEDAMKVPVCPSYKWGKCPDFENCEYRHPPRCWSWLESGKCPRRQCRFHHPPLCYQSLWQRQCLNLNCKFFHLTRTLRFKMEDEQLKNSLNAGNYHNQFPSLPQPQLQQPPQPQLNQPPQSQLNQPQQHYQPQSHPVVNLHPQAPPNIQTPVQVSQQPNNIPQHQHQSTNPSNLQDHHSFSKSDLTFLAQIIKETIKEDLSKQVASLKQNLEMKIQLANRQPIMPTNAIPQAQMHPFMFNQPQLIR
jgi:hypothetical protein